MPKRHARVIDKRVTDAATVLVELIDKYVRWHEEIGFSAIDPLYRKHPVFPVVERLEELLAVLPGKRMPSPGEQLWVRLLGLTNCPPDCYAEVFTAAIAFRDWLAQQFRINQQADEAGPYWHSELRQLWLGDKLIKEYRRPARNQERILSAFQEDGWRERIDSPLHEDQLPYAIRDLQCTLQKSPIAIERDGSGKGLRWRLRTRKNASRTSPVDLS